MLLLPLLTDPPPCHRAGSGYGIDVTRRPWLIPLVAFVASVALFVAGCVAWRVTAAPPLPRCPSGALACQSATFGRVHLHPLRAELLWAGSVVFVLVAVGTGLRGWRRRAEPSPRRADG
jgi:hypothetical protein